MATHGPCTGCVAIMSTLTGFVQLAFCVPLFRKPRNSASQFGGFKPMRVKERMRASEATCFRSFHSLFHAHLRIARDHRLMIACHDGGDIRKRRVVKDRASRVSEILYY